MLISKITGLKVILKFLHTSRRMNGGKKCFLISKEDAKKIELRHKETVCIGRSRDTEIQNKIVSKKQLEFYADLERSKVFIKQIGKAVSGINGFAVQSGKTYKVGHGDIVEFRLGEYKYEVVFDKEEVDEPLRKKPKTDFPIFNNPKTMNANDSIIKQDKGNWEEIDNKELLVYTPTGCESREKIASFDIDGTIIKTKSGAKFPKDKNDWVFYLDNVPKELRKLSENNYKIVFFTNQAGVGKDSQKVKDFKTKIENITKALQLPVQTFIATCRTKYRKPIPGMWDTLVEHKNENISIHTSESFFVGDSAGREKNWAPKRNKDFACTDRLFAMNIGIKFYTPEEYFLKSRPAPFKMPDFDPRQSCITTIPDLKYDKQNVILMVGGPGSGKSVFCKKHLIPSGYVHVSRDVLGSWQKCVKSLEEQLSKNRNVVIDNTNVDGETRKRFIEVAVKFNADVRCFVMDVSVGQMRHNNKFRELTDTSHAIVTDIIILSYNKNYQEPDLSEGYSQILKIPFVPQFEDRKKEKLYKMYLVD